MGHRTWIGSRGRISCSPSFELSGAMYVVQLLRPELQNMALFAVGRRHASLANVSADPAGNMAQLTHGLLVPKSKTHCGPVENRALVGARKLPGAEPGNPTNRRARLIGGLSQLPFVSFPPPVNDALPVGVEGSGEDQHPLHREMARCYKSNPLRRK